MAAQQQHRWSPTAGTTAIAAITVLVVLTLSTTKGGQFHNIMPDHGRNSLHVTRSNIAPPQNHSANVSWEDLATYMQGCGVPSNIAPLTSLAGPARHGICPNHLECTKLHQQAVTAEQCQHLDTLHEIDVLVCSITTNGRRTSTVLIYELHARDSGNSSNMLAQSVYRVRVVGREVVQPEIHYCGRMAASMFELTTDAAYHVELLQLYDNFTYDQHPPVLTEIHAANGEFMLTKLPLVSSERAPLVCMPGHKINVSSTASLAKTTSSGGNHSLCPVCSSYNHPGRWVVSGVDGNNTALLRALRHTCHTRMATSLQADHSCTMVHRLASSPEVEDDPPLEWLPYTCRYRKITHVMGGHCKAGLVKLQRQACFMGDSQMRHLYNQVVHLMEGPSAGLQTIINKQVLNSYHLKFTNDTYGESATTSNSSHCTHVFVNFGQWPLSYVEKQPWSVHRYAHQVQLIARHMASERIQYGNRQYWVTTGPFPLHEKLHQWRHDQVGSTRGVDWRTEPFLLLFNKVANTIMKAHDIDIVDTFSIASPLFDLSYDGAHYLGLVGLTQANIIMNIICKDFL